MSLLGLFLGVGVWRALGAPRRRGRAYFARQLANLRRALGLSARRPVLHVEHLADGELQVLMGRLRADGQGCESYDGEAAVAASTVECPLSEIDRDSYDRDRVSLRRRARRLVLELDGGEVALEGELEVLVGARQHHPRKRLHGLPRALCERVVRDRPPWLDPSSVLREPPVIRNLMGGETVIVAGRVVADGAGEGRAQSAPGVPYRDPVPSRWTMTPSSVSPVGDATAPAVFALYAGTPAIPLSPVVRFGLGPLAWAAAGLMLMAAIGGLSLRLAVQSDLVPDQRGANTLALRHVELPVRAPALAVAATMPFHRAQALELLAEGLSETPLRGRAIVEARVAVEYLAGDCAAAAGLLWEHQQPQRAAELAARCLDTSDGDDAARQVIGLAWMDLGHYARASAAFAVLARDHVGRADADDERAASALAFSYGTDAAGLLDPGSREGLSVQAVAHVLAGEWGLAERMLRRLAERRDLDGDDVAAYACLADAAAERAGAGDDRAGIEARARSFRSPVCTLLAADLSPRRERRTWLHYERIPWATLGKDERGRRLLYLRELLARELEAQAGAPARARDTVRLLSAGVPGGATPYESLPALESAVLEELYSRFDLARGERVLRMAIAARAAGLAAHMGQHERAAALRERVMRDAQELAQRASDAKLSARAAASWQALRGDALLLAAVIHWRADDLDAAWDALEQARGVAPAPLLARVESVLAFEARREVSASLAAVLTGRPLVSDEAGAGNADLAWLRSIVAGDGGELARLVEEARVIPNAVGMLAPAVTSGHPRLVELLHWGPRRLDPRSVASELWYDGARAFAAERLGEHELARAVRAAASRRYQALADRDAVVLVYLIEQM